MHEILTEIRQSAPSKFETIWAHVPFVGKVIEMLMYKSRFNEYVLRINRTLNVRLEEDIISSWRQVGHDYEIAKKLMNISQSWMGWPKPFFLPSDPVAVVFWAYDDDLDADDAKLEIEETFKIVFSDDDIIKSVDLDFGDFVEMIESKTKTNNY